MWTAVHSIQAASPRAAASSACSRAASPSPRPSWAEGTSSNSGTANATTVGNGAIQYVFAGASASGTTVASGAYQLDYGSAFATTLSSGAKQYVYNGALASDTTMVTGAIQQYVLAGAVASNTSVVSGAFQLVRGSASGTTLAAGAKEYVYSGATASNTTVGSGALQYVVASGMANNNTVNAGGLQYVYGSASGTTMSGAGVLGYVFNGGVATNLSIIGSGATEQVNLGGVLIGGSVTNSALEYILGSGNNIVVSGAGALLQMYRRHHLDHGWQRRPRGRELRARSTAPRRSPCGGDQIVLATATAVSATVATSGRQDVLGSASATTVSGFNGRMVISSGAHATGDRIFSGGVETINNGGVTTGTFVSGIGGGQQATETVNAGGVASNTSVGSGGRILVVGGTTSNAVISSGASEIVSNGGTASSTTISGGTVTVLSGGAAAAATIIGRPRSGVVGTASSTARR